MGIPKFFRFITKKHQQLIIDPDSDIDQDFELLNIRAIKNLYLDTNCLIHPCCRKIIDNFPELINKHNIQYSNNENNINNEINIISVLEQKMFNECINYIVKLYNFVKPTELLYIAIDGVAPRAKMEQQRIRRYRSNIEQKFKEQIYIKHQYHNQYYWDTNAITPGTTFMLKLSYYFQNNINKIIKDNINIILSDTSVCGEGEHKIVQYIRNNNNQDISCIYGLDADLIMLSLCLENDIYLLRESIQFNIIDNDKLLYLSIKSFKNILKKEIIDNIDIREITDFELDERVVIDYVFLCFLLGNDFLPHLVTLDISEGSLNQLLLIYTKLISIRKKYIINDSNIDYTFLQQILSQLYNYEDITLQIFQKNIDKRNIPNKFYHSLLEKDLDLIKYYPIRYKKKNIDLGSKNWRDDYYKHYFYIKSVNKSKDYIDNLCKIYLEGLQWNLKYYLNDCPSWKWYFPYPAAPCLRELCQYLNNRIYYKDFGISKPYLPIQQLFIILPKQSSHLLPKSYSELIHSKCLDIILYYPDNVSLDISNKLWLHECNPILPIINDQKIIYQLNKIKLSGIDLIKNTLNNQFIYIKYKKNIL
mgnify:CR=1 FL=1